MEETLREHLFELADRFEAASKLTRQTIGQRALKDNTFFLRLTRGDGFTIKTFDKVVQWFSDNWPEDAVWPDNVPRPSSLVLSPRSPFQQPREVDA